MVGHTFSLVRTITSDTNSRTRVVTVMATLAPSSGSSANGANITAASGGYVKGRSIPPCVAKNTPSP